MTGTHLVVRLSEDLLEILRCPLTGQTLRQDGAELVTTGAGPEDTPLRYPIDEGIPVLLPATAPDDTFGTLPEAGH
ncbi:hypothetical protein ODZ83_06660 [Acaricomes phytoseiuli]|uniref:Trm112 family protein n=1 Tax=Acaricomes phytoseiuli TaxID=291968 RepID=UPI0003A656A0|nr:hypothetical protein [Acaricomes phytoseiuli]MCW1249869.1 hypothetical protein [Acaricomes phytoseiuli]